MPERAMVLGDVAELIRGVSYRPKDLLPPGPGAVPLLRATNIGNRSLELTEVLHVPAETVREPQFLRRFDVVIAMSSGSRLAVGRLAQLRHDWKGCVGAFCGVIRPNPKAILPEFLGYVLHSPAFRERIETYAEGTAIMNLSRERLLGFPLELPDRETQRSAAIALGSLDDKIAVNRRMNQTLEAMARALFKSWFVDFEPVRAKAEGRDTGLPKPIADLFPESFEDSDFGQIPTGFQVRSLYDCARYTNGSVFRNEDFSPSKSGLPVIKIGELKSGISGQTKFTEEILETKYRVKSGDILFSWSGSPDTSIGSFVWEGGDGWLNQHIFKIEFNRPEEKFFVHFLLRHLLPTFIEIARNKQTTGLGHVTVQDLKRLKTAIPPDAILRAFNRLAEPLFEKAYRNSRESNTLSALRDTLLPKLISGNIRTKNAEVKSGEGS